MVASLNTKEKSALNKVNKTADNHFQVDIEHVEHSDLATKELIESIKAKEECVIAKMRTSKKSQCNGACCT